MEYNTSLPHLIIPEYGRNIQKMIDFAIEVKDRDERNKVAQSIIDVMGQLNPHLRDITDFKHKLFLSNETRSNCLYAITRRERERDQDR